mmetsp:Transcript_18619/g.33314  ORF Transcript_18619/g.33314 Transcript_18619/m.33314 type:complete len:443 (-) Transcript_18619:123-1451(-)
MHVPSLTRTTRTTRTTTQALLLAALAVVVCSCAYAGRSGAWLGAGLLTGSSAGTRTGRSTMWQPRQAQSSSSTVNKQYRSRSWKGGAGDASLGRAGAGMRGALRFGMGSGSGVGCQSAAEITEITRKTMEVLKSKTKENENMGKMVQILEGFMNEYAETNIQAETTPEKFQQMMTQSMAVMGQALLSPHKFDILHRAIRQPFDYYRWGVDFFRPLLEKHNSKIYGKQNLDKIVDYIKSGENVILLSNHQTEVDPQAIEILLEDSDNAGDLASQLIFVAGHKVTTDPLAIPFSLGQNLLCIHSKKYIENPPEKKAEKQAHNTKTMKKMQSLLEDGGTFLWVAPSGGRDRPEPATKEFVVAPFDERSVQMFKLMATKAKSMSGKKTHFFPMAMLTHELVPPPDGVKAAVGEKRSAKRGAANIWFGDEVADEKIEGMTSKEQNKK